jgi:hypothetical protein
MNLRRLIPLGILALVGCGKTVGDGDGVVDEDEVVQVGWIAELTGHHHDVEGTAELIDERTVEITGFDYDGGGINSRFFLLADGEPFHREFEISDNLVGGDYADDTLTLTLPDDIPDDAWNLITLWCVPAAVSFGDGVFRAP